MTTAATDAAAALTNWYRHVVVDGNLAAGWPLTDPGARFQLALRHLMGPTDDFAALVTDPVYLEHLDGIRALCADDAPSSCPDWPTFAEATVARLRRRWAHLAGHVASARLGDDYMSATVRLVDPDDVGVFSAEITYGSVFGVAVGPTGWQVTGLTNA